MYFCYENRKYINTSYQIIQFKIYKKFMQEKQIKHINLLLKKLRCLMFLLQVPNISIEHRWQVSMMCTLLRVVQDIDCPLYFLLPESRVVIRENRQTDNLNYLAFNVVEHRTGQFSRMFL